MSKINCFFFLQAALGLEFQPWIDQIFPNGKLVDICAIEYILQTYTARMKRLVGGAWIKLFLDNTNDLINGINIPPKAVFYGSNEIQVAAILNTLDVYKPHVPGYASTILFELHAVNNEFYVKVYFIYYFINLLNFF